MKRIMACFCMAVMVGSGALRGAEALRIPVGEAAKTDEPYLVEKAIPFYTRHLVDSFDPATIQIKERIPDILAIRKALALRYASGNLAYCELVFREKAQALVKGGCKDAGVALMQAENRKLAESERLKVVDAAIAELKKSANPNAVVAMLLRMKALTLKADDARDKAFCESFAAAFSCEGGFEKADPRITLRFLKPVKNGKKHPAGIFMVQMPDPWVQMVLRGEDLGSEAFESRGSDLGHRVTEEGWKGFAQKNQSGYTLLEAAHRLHPEWPDAAAELAEIAHHTGDKSATYWLNQVLARSFDMPEAVKRFGHFTTSRWCGSTEALIETGKACMRTKRYDSLLPLAGMRIALETVTRYEMGSPEVAEARLRADRELFELLYATAEGYLAAPASLSTGPRDTYARAGIVVALIDRDWAKARAFAGRLGVKKQTFQDWPFLGFMPTVRTTHFYSPATQILLNGRFLDDAVRADAFAYSGKSAEAITLFQEIRNRKNATEADRNYCDSRLYFTRIRAGMKSGEWFSLMPTPSNVEGMSFWTNCKVEKGVARGKNNTQSVQCGAVSLPDNAIEFAGTIHFFPNEKQKKWEAGWSFNHRYDRANYAPEFQFIREGGEDTLLVRRWKREHKKVVLEGTPATRDFRAEVNNGRFIFVVDGKTVLDESAETFLSDTPTLHLGGNCCLPVIHMHVNTGISDYRARVLPGWNQGSPWRSPAFND